MVEGVSTKSVLGSYWSVIIIFSHVRFIFIISSPTPVRNEKQFAQLDTEQNHSNSVNRFSSGTNQIYRVFCLVSTPFIPQVEQYKLNSCSIGCLSKTLQGLSYRHLNFSFFLNFKSFSKNSNSGTEKRRVVQFTPKFSRYDVVFLVRKLGAQLMWFEKYDEFIVKK